MKQFSVKDEMKVKELFLNSFLRECQPGWDKILIIILNENLLSFVAFDGDDLVNIVFDKSKKELLGEDLCLIDKNNLNSLKSNLIEVMNQQAEQ